MSAGRSEGSRDADVADNAVLSSKFNFLSKSSKLLKNHKKFKEKLNSINYEYPLILEQDQIKFRERRSKGSKDMSDNHKSSA